VPVPSGKRSSNSLDLELVNGCLIGIEIEVNATIRAIKTVKILWGEFFVSSKTSPDGPFVSPHGDEATQSANYALEIHADIRKEATFEGMSMAAMLSVRFRTDTLYKRCNTAGLMPDTVQRAMLLRLLANIDQQIAEARYLLSEMPADGEDAEQIHIWLSDLQASTTRANRVLGSLSAS
jgi:hypothetical protein